jgi:hypothetical protein
VVKKKVLSFRDLVVVLRSLPIFGGESRNPTNLLILRILIRKGNSASKKDLAKKIKNYLFNYFSLSLPRKNDAKIKKYSRL